MYCSHCGYDLNESRQKKASKTEAGFRTENTKIAYVCPRCGHVIKTDLSEEEIKSLSRASHAEIHRARNSLNRGMCFLVIGSILAIVAFLFFLMSFKAALGGQLSTTCTEFYVFIALTVIGVAGIGYGGYSLRKGIVQNKKYSELLKDINNGVFIQ